MEKFVKVTNITHQSSRGAFGAWIANKYLEPGLHCMVPLSLLPPDWQTMGTIFSFEFQENVEPESLDPTPVINRDSLKEVLSEVVKEHLSGLQPQNSGISKEDLLEILSKFSSSAPSSSAGSLDITPAYIPSIKDVEDSQIAIETKIEKVGSVSDLRAKLKRSRG